MRDFGGYNNFRKKEIPMSSFRDEEMYIKSKVTPMKLKDTSILFFW